MLGYASKAAARELIATIETSSCAKAGSCTLHLKKKKKIARNFSGGEKQQIVD